MHVKSQIVHFYMHHPVFGINSDCSSPTHLTSAIIITVTVADKAGFPSIFERTFNIFIDWWFVLIIKQNILTNDQRKIILTNHRGPVAVCLRNAMTPVHPRRVQQKCFLGIVVRIPLVRRLTSVCIQHHCVVRWMAFDTLRMTVVMLIVVAQYCYSNHQWVNEQSKDHCLRYCIIIFVYKYQILYFVLILSTNILKYLFNCPVHVCSI